MKTHTVIKKDREFYNLKAKSNLNYTKDMTVDVRVYGDSVFLDFSTGFKTEAKLSSVTEDRNGNIICIYTYNGNNNETHYLHMRVVNGKGFFFQTVQTGKNPGGSTFNSNEYSGIKKSKSYNYKGKINTTPESIKKIISGQEVEFVFNQYEDIDIK